MLLSDDFSLDVKDQGSPYFQEHTWNLVQVVCPPIIHGTIEYLAYAEYPFDY